MKQPVDGLGSPHCSHGRYRIPVPMGLHCLTEEEARFMQPYIHELEKVRDNDQEVTVL